MTVYGYKLVNEYKYLFSVCVQEGLYFEASEDLIICKRDDGEGSDKLQKG